VPQHCLVVPRLVREVQLNTNCDRTNFVFPPGFSNQICLSVKRNYIFKDEVDEIKFKEFLVKDFIEINNKFPDADKKTFRKQANESLKKFDPHLILIYDPQQMQGHIQHGRIDKVSNRFILDEDPERETNIQKNNYGFEEKPPKNSPVIPDSVGYLKITGFFDVDSAKQKVTEIM